MKHKLVFPLLVVLLTTVAAPPAWCGRYYLTASGEHYFGGNVSGDSLNADGTFQDLWIYAGLPSFTIAGKKVFSAVEADLLHRQITYNGAPLNGSPHLFHRYGIFAGVTLFTPPGQKGSFMVGPGIATDFSKVNDRIGYLHLIYDHRFTVSKKLTIGLGIVAQYHFDAWRVPLNLLPTLRWDINPQTKLAINWDNLQLSRRIFPRTLVVGELRYDLSFFRSRDRLSYELETVSAGGGFDVRLGKRSRLRIRYQELLMHREIIRKSGDALVDLDGGRGRSVKLLLVTQ